jgi:predicted aconitase with swiveling domain
MVKGRGVTPGYGEGKILISKQPFMFSHGVEPRTGNIIDIRSDIFGENIRGKVLIFPFGKGSTTGSAWILEMIRQGNRPAAIINIETESIIVTGFVMAHLLYGISIPLVDRLEKDITDSITEDSIIQVNGNIGEVRIV